MKQQKPRRSLIGVVTSDKMQKTITVRVDRLTKHPRYKKYIRASTFCKVHDEKQEARIGDRVKIVETRPLSKTKCWRLVQIVSKGSGEAR